MLVFIVGSRGVSRSFVVLTLLVVFLSVWVGVAGVVLVVGSVVVFLFIPWVATVLALGRRCASWATWAGRGVQRVGGVW